MKIEHLLIGLVAFAFLVPYSTAVVGGPEAGEGEAVILGGGSSASASQAVGPNGTEWRAEVSMVNRTQDVSEDRIENVEYGQENYTVEFDGFITAPTPCHTIGHEVRKSDEGYMMNVDTVREAEDRSCAQVITTIEYDGSFSTDEDFTLEVRHENETVETLEHPGIEDQPGQKRGFFSKLFGFFGGLF